MLDIPLFYVYIENVGYTFMSLLGDEQEIKNIIKVGFKGNFSHKSSVTICIAKKGYLFGYFVMKSCLKIGFFVLFL